MTEQWVCEAYGLEGLKFGALCFRSAEMGKRVCSSQDECRQVIANEQRRVFRWINELAAAGDEAAAYLGQKISSPGQILGGDQAGKGDQ